MGTFRLTNTQWQGIIHFAFVLAQIYIAPKHPELVPAIAALQGVFGFGMQDKT